ncbi:MAG TPA: hypothetical protein VFN56_03955 [Candidatus Saccharimonadales bacterium]|nr:hypothetical protein [Candidatus Saccharimonadales bacterium]
MEYETAPDPESTVRRMVDVVVEAGKSLVAAAVEPLRSSYTCQTADCKTNGGVKVK